MPAVEVGEGTDWIRLRVEQRRCQHQDLGPEPALADDDADLADGQVVGQASIGRLVHAGRALVRLGPGHDVVVRAQPPAGPEVHPPPLMDPEDPRMGKGSGVFLKRLPTPFPADRGVPGRKGRRNDSCLWPRRESKNRLRLRSRPYRRWPPPCGTIGIGRRPKNRVANHDLYGPANRWRQQCVNPSFGWVALLVVFRV